ncbi:hypothetical protein AB0J86_32060 [Micromonospora sp. NPDC049559]|uniref:hypothetical protein n=1 Tax=Micromonospora sp. NPDC049559 TaxID=3155923 RepID=UPI0034368192
MTSRLIDTRSSRSARLPAAGLVAAPLGWLAGWAIMRLGGSSGPNTGWDVAHALWIVSFVLFGAAAYALFRLLGGSPAARVALAVALTGAAALVVQMVIDLVVGLRTADKPAMVDLYDRVFAVPGVELVFFTVGPMLLFVGLLALVVLATVRRVAAPWQVLLVVAGIGLMVAGRPASGALRLLEGLGAACLWLALAPLARPAAPSSRPRRPGLD